MNKFLSCVLLFALLQMIYTETPCSIGQIFKDNACVACPKNCAKCADINTCQQCYPHFTVKENLCVPDGCSAIADNDFAIGDDKALYNCHRCPDQTRTCNRNFKDSQTCEDYHWLEVKDANRICKPCSFQCRTCTSSSTCTVCSPRAYLVKGKCTLCSEKMSNCATCSPNEGASTNILCETAVIGYRVANDKLSAEKCTLDNCANCADEKGVCKACVPKFYLAEQKCLACGTYCTQCTKEACISCQEGYYPKAGVCTLCGDNCGVCQQNDAHICILCKSGFYNNIDQTDQTKCYSCTDPNCQTCKKDLPAICDSCVAKFVSIPDTGNQPCKQCPLNCDQCDNSKTCVKCSNYFQMTTAGGSCSLITSNCPFGWYKKSTTSCEKCQLHCSICTSSKNCLYCDPAYNDCKKFSSLLSTKIVVVLAAMLFLIFQ